MIFRSVCSGIEAASVAWHPLGWRADAFAEIEKFPSAVLAHHYPNVPNLGDMTKYKDWPDATFDVLVGGTPCQSFSVAGLRKGLADPRGNLALVYLGILDRYRPRWMVWENVPGVLSSWSDDPDSPAQDDGHGYEIAKQRNDFDCFLGGLAELGYGCAYRVLDAQYIRVDGFSRAVPQRRRRVFVVGHLGSWQSAAAVLFERDSMSGHPAPRREAGKGTAPTLAARTKGGGGLGTDFDIDGGLVAKPASGLDLPGVRRKQLGNERSPNCNDLLRIVQPHTFGGGNSEAIDVATAQTAHAGRIDFESETFVAHALRGEGFDASEDGTGRGTPLVPIRFSSKDHGADAANNIAPTLRAMGHANSHPNAGGQLAVAFDMRGREGGAQFEGPHETANIRAASGGSSRSYVAEHWRVRRLTPVECERLMGFPDDYTLVPGASKGGWRDVDETEVVEELKAAGLKVRLKGNVWRVQDPDGPRYKALGNSMAVNCMGWIGRRIEMVEAIKADEVAE